MEKLKGMLLDFGGTIDTNGIHWFSMFSNAYSKAQINVDDDVLRDAYVFAERTLGRQSIIKPDYTFSRTIREKIRLQSEFLLSQGTIISNDRQNKVLDICYDSVESNITNISIPTLKSLNELFPLVLVTNFYGNMHTVLKEFALDIYFLSVIESSVVGVRKPDPEIFRLGVGAISGANPEDTVMVGDSADKDIIPSASIGCKTIWLRNQAWDESSAKSDYQITDFRELPAIINK
jgi:putative hydrolase of the HAD superfamily